MGKSIISKEDLSTFIKDYKNGMCPKELSEKYKIGYSGIISKLKKLNIYVSSQNKWSTEEIEYLKIHYSNADWDEILNNLNGRNRESVQQEASRLNLSKDNYFWSNNDIQILKDNYSYGNINNIIKLLDNKFTYSAIASKAEKLGFKTREYWTNKELEMMNKYYPLKSLDEMELLLPDRNRKTIIQKAYELNIRNISKFSKEQEKFIIDNWMNMTDIEIANQIDKTQGGINNKRRLLGLLRIKENSSYNDLSEYVRRNNIEWKKKSMIASNYICIFTGDRFDEIHHAYGLNLILNEVLEELDITIKETMDDYTDIELRNILDLFRIRQEEYPLGLCLRKDIHILFHSLYGYGNNTPEQWYQFEIDFKDGLYKDKLNIAS